MLKAILFDLDGTLLPMNQEQFIDLYKKTIYDKAQECGYDGAELLNTIQMSIYKMVNNDGSKTNDVVFKQAFVDADIESILDDTRFSCEYYNNEFLLLKKACYYNKDSKIIIDFLKSKGYKIVVATNPVWPAIATQQRVKWAGLNPNDFDFYTTYENSSYCKPNVLYYQEILNKLGCTPEECLMVGNDVGEDMIAGKLGIKTFLLTDCLINPHNLPTDHYVQGDFKKLLEYIESL